MEINYRELQTLKAQEFEFVAQIEGEFNQEYYPTLELKLKVGAQIIMITHDARGRWVNGSLGKVKKCLDLEKSKPILVVELEDGMICNLAPYTWSITKLILEEGELINEQVGYFTQYPLILAWAITIHKSQGKTFSKAIIDLKGAFVHEQSYVALSRCTSIDGLVLKQPLLPKDLICDLAINNFFNELKIKLLQEAISQDHDLNLVYKKSNQEIFKLKIKPQQIKPNLSVVADYLEENIKFRRVFFLAQMLELRKT